MRKAKMEDLFEYLEMNKINIVENKVIEKKYSNGASFKGTAFRLDRRLSKDEVDVLHQVWSNVEEYSTFCEYAPEIAKQWVAIYPFTIRYMNIKGAGLVQEASRCTKRYGGER